MKTVGVTIVSPRGQAWLRISSVLVGVVALTMPGICMIALTGWSALIATVASIAFLGGGFYAVKRLLRPQPATLGIEVDELILTSASGPARRISKSGIDSAQVSAASPVDRLQLSIGGRPLVITLPEGEADSFLGALKLRRRVTTRLSAVTERGRALAFGFGSLAGLVAALVAGAFAAGRIVAATKLPQLGVAAGILTALFVVGATVWMLSRMPAITLGADGIALADGKFVPFSSFQGLRVSRRNNPGNEYAVELDAGSEPTQTLASYDKACHRDAVAFARHIETAWRAWMDATATEASALAALETGAPSLGQWMTDLRKEARERDGYRKKSLESEQLVAILENPTAPAKYRIGAAVVLNERSDAGARDRIRVAAAASANPRLRVALTSIAEQAVEEARIAEAIEDASARDKRGA